MFQEMTEPEAHTLPVEPRMGVMSMDDGQHRFWFVPRVRSSQLDLFDTVSGLLLRSVGQPFMARALFLHEPGCWGGDGLNNEGGNGADLEAFMLLLGLQAGLSEYLRMPRTQSMP